MFVRLNSTCHEERLIFVGSDSQDAISKTVAWATNMRRERRCNYVVRYTTLYDRNKGIAAHPLMYMSMLLNLKLAIQCNAWVGTLASNTVRLIDELRSTVGGKIDGIFIDLSRETCQYPPCAETGITSFGWRI